MSRGKRIVIAALVAVCWLSIAPRLVPLPPERVAAMKATAFEPVPWESAEVNSTLRAIAKPPVWALWAEWLRQLGLIVLGVGGAAALLVGRRGGLVASAGAALVHLGLWYHDHTTHILAGIVETPEGALLRDLFEGWEAAS